MPINSKYPSIPWSKEGISFVPITEYPFSEKNLDMTDKLDELAQAALDELVAEFELPPRLPGDLTLPEIANGMKITISSARDRMNKKIEAGEWYAIKVFSSKVNKGVRVYRKGKPDNEE